MPTAGWEEDELLPVYDVDCFECGLIFSAPEGEQLLRFVALHFHARHGHIRTMTEGVHWTRSLTPLRCDVCGVNIEPPAWRHWSDAPLDQPGVRDRDLLWTLCDTCHELHAARDLPGLVRRALEHYKERSQIPVRGERETRIRVYLAERMRLYIQHLDAGFRLEHR